jgi:hypothetical protein
MRQAQMVVRGEEDKFLEHLKGEAKTLVAARGVNETQVRESVLADVLRRLNQSRPAKDAANALAEDVKAFAKRYLLSNLPPGIFLLLIFDDFKSRSFEPKYNKLSHAAVIFTYCPRKTKRIDLFMTFFQNHIDVYLFLKISHKMLIFESDLLKYKLASKAKSIYFIKLEVTIIYKELELKEA